jgi:hypothetical protein
VEADRLFVRLAELGIRMPEVTRQLLDEGITKFQQPYDALLAALEKKRGA